MRKRLGMLRRHSIWDPELLREVPARFRGLYTVLLPAHHLALMTFGLFSLVAVHQRSSPPSTLEEATTVGFAGAWSAAVVLLSASALAALATRLGRTELVVLIALVCLLVSYPFALIAVGFSEGSAIRIALGFAMLGFLLLPAWRAVDLVRTERRRNV